jgi:hypothetical protein
MAAAQLADGLACLAAGLGSDCASVDDDGILKPGGAGVAAHDFGLEGVESATQSNDASLGHGRPNQATDIAVLAEDDRLMCFDE